jgi:hypothetical protein
MFWESVTKGLGMLTHWQTYVAATIALLMPLTPNAVVYLVSKRAGETVQGTVTFAWYLLVTPFLYAFAFLGFVLITAPLMLGFGDSFSWAMPLVLIIAAPSLVAKVLLVLVVTATLMGFLPLLGNMISFRTLVLGIIALIMVVGLLQSLNPELTARHIDFWPGFWFTAAILAISTVLGFIGMGLAGIVAAITGGLATPLLLPFTHALTFIPLFTYAAWLGRPLH